MSRAIQPLDWSLRMTQGPTAEPLTLDQGKDACRIPVDPNLTEHDTFITDAIAAARAWIELAYDVKIMPQKWELLLQNFPRGDTIRFPVGPVQTFDYFRYIDTGYNEQELIIGRSPTAQVLARLSKKPAELVLPFGKVWPAVILQTADAITIGATLGYKPGASPDLAPIPPQVKQAMKLLIGHWFDNRSAITLGTLMKSDPIAHGVESLMATVGFSSYN